ncbi:MAG: site-specific integrase [Clostridiales bacterium]|nr:site-specific integrase [Clostridiales bacterium]
MREVKSLRNAKGDGSFRKKGYRVEYRITYTDEFGISRKKSFTADDEETCLDRAEEFYEKLDQRLCGIAVDATIPDILRKKIEGDYRKNYTGEQGYGRNLATIKIIEKHGIGHMPVAEITEGHLNLFLQAITHYSNNMISKIYSMIRMAFNIAYDEKIVERNYMLLRSLRCPRSDKPDKKVRGLTEDEQKRFVVALKKHKVPYGRNSYKLQLLIELYGGLRMGEINALTPENINFEKGYIHVSRTVSRGIECREFIKETPKTYAGIRDIPINKMLEPLLREAIAIMKDNPEGLIFYDYNKGSVVTTYQVNCFYRRMCEKAKIPYNGQHALRHTFASRCIEADIPALVLKSWLGHTNIHVTLDTYADVFNRMNFNAMEKFDSYIDKLKDEEE